MDPADDAFFEYWLSPLDDQDLDERLRRLVEKIAAHAAKHDFAQRIHVEGIAVREWPADAGLGAGRAVVVPFHREHFREMPAIAFYLKELGRENRFRLAAMMLPGGGCIPM